MTRIALNWYVWETTHSAVALGTLTFFYTGPVIVGGLVAGWLLDRFDRRKVMLYDSVLRAVSVAIVPLFSWLGILELWHVYLVAAVYGSLFMISLAGGPSIVPTLVKEEHLSTANALETMSFTLSNVLGPPIAGMLISFIGAPNVIIIDSLSYLLFALFLTQVRYADKDQVEESDTEDVTDFRLVDAPRLLFTNKVLQSTTLMFLAANIAMGMFFVWMPIFVEQELGGGADLYGLLLGILAGGEVISSILAGIVSLPLPLGALIGSAQFLAGLALGLMVLSGNLWITIISLALFGFLSAPLTIWAQTLRMKIIPEALRGRTFAFLRMLMMSGFPIGGMIAGAILSFIGMPAMIGLSAFIIGAPGSVGLGVKELRKADG